jgi:hypothetical protein
VFFDLKDTEVMEKVSSYYNLPAPFNKDNIFNTVDHHWDMFFRVGYENFLGKVKMGSIKFVDNIPTYFKYYKYVPS